MLLRGLFVALIFFLVSSPVLAQVVPSDASARSLALGQSEIAEPQDEWSPNPGYRADTSSHIRMMLAPAPNNLAGSWTAGLSGDFPVDSGISLGAGFSRNEYELVGYSWESIGVQASKTFHVSGTDTTLRLASAGIRFRYGEETLGPIYLPLEDMTADLGMTFDLYPKLTAGASVTHLFTLYHNQNYPVEDRAAWLALTYYPLDELAVHAALEATAVAPPAFHVGIEYSFDQYLVIRVGIIRADSMTGINQISGGFGVRTGSLVADFAAVRDANLGTSISFGIGFDL